ncbi:short-chain dehydrogenase [Pseudofrankia sp. BMG5.36]|nr:short-chain dehydrogenase [Pseudofrankia sp. BMG5.36]
MRPTSGKLLEGKAALVTGATRGLGRAIAEAFAAAGANVIVVSRKPDAVARAADQISARSGQKVFGVAAHVGDWNQCTALVERAYELVDRVDVLVNNAGIAPLYSALHDASEELFDKTLGVNLKGPFRLSSLVAQRMLTTGGGSIINVSSVAAVRPTQHEIPYGAAKAGLHVLTTGIALAYGPTVRANTIMPGPFLTDIAAGWDMEKFGEFAARMPMRRAGAPDEITGAALYLASGMSSFTTGALLRVDGGQALVRD